MAHRARRAEARAQRRQGAVESLAAVDEEDSDDNEEMDEAPARVPQRKLRGLAVAPPLALNPGMWCNMVNMKLPYLADLEIESIKNFILDYNKVFSKSVVVNCYVTYNIWILL